LKSINKSHKSRIHIKRERRIKEYEEGALLVPEKKYIVD